MNSSRIRKSHGRVAGLLAGAGSFFLMGALAGCLQSEPKASDGQAPGAEDSQVKQVSAHLDKPYPLTPSGEVVAEFPPELLAAMKENLRNQGLVKQATDLDELYDNATGKLRDADRLPEIQNSADTLSRALGKGGAR